MAVKSMLGKTTEFWMGEKVYVGTQTYVKIANVRSISDISTSSTTIDVTEYGTGMNRQYIAGLADTTDMTITLASESPSVDMFETAKDTATEVAVKIILPSKKIISFDASVTGYSYAIPVDGAYQFTATLKPSGEFVRSYTISFNGNGGSGHMEPVVFDAGEEATIPPCGFTAPAGKEFTCWNTARDGSGDSFEVGQVIEVTQAVTMFALWENVVPTTFAITFDANGGTGTMETIAVVEGGSFEVPECGFTAPEHATFRFWNTEADGSGVSYVVGAMCSPIADMTLFAIWETRVRVIISFDPNGGSGTMADIQSYAGELVTIPTATFTPPDFHRFSGVYNDGMGEEYVAGRSYVFNNDATLSAHYVETLYEVALLHGLGEGTMSPLESIGGAAVTFPESTFVPPEGEVFDEWQNCEDASEVHPVGYTFVPTRNMEFRATFRPQ